MTARRQRAEAQEIPYRPQGRHEGGWWWCGGQEGTGSKGEGVGVKSVSMDNKAYYDSPALKKRVIKRAFSQGL